MSVQIACEAVDPEFLVAEIERRKAVMPFDEIDSYGNPLTIALTGEEAKCLEPRSHIPLWYWDNSRLLIEIDTMTQQLLSADVSHSSCFSIEAKRAAEYLNEMVGPFLTCLVTRNGKYNDLGLPRHTILSPWNIQRHLNLFRRIDWKALQPVYEKHCQMDDCGAPYKFCIGFDQFKGFIDGFGDVLVQAAETGRMLYIFAT